VFSVFAVMLAVASHSPFDRFLGPGTSRFAGISHKNREKPPKKEKVANWLCIFIRTFPKSDG
jgi:hypothetical protein